MIWTVSKMLIISRKWIAISFNCLISKHSFYIEKKNPHLCFLHYGTTMLGPALMLSSQQTQMTHKSFIWLLGGWWRKIQICKRSIKIRLKINSKYIPWWFSGQRTSVWLTVGLDYRSSLTEHIQIFSFAMKFDQPRQIADSWLPVSPVPWTKGSPSQS